MSADREQPAAHRLCPHCGAPLQPDQDWCLECGTAATTRVMPPPSWKVPAAVVLAVLVAFGVAVVIAVSVLSRDAERSVADVSPAASSEPVGAATESPAAAKPKAAAKAKAAGVVSAATGASGTTGESGASGATGSAVAEWDESKEAYTVVLVTSDRTGAEKVAKAAAADAGEPAGILESSKYQFFSPGYWVAWAGQFEAKPDAQKLADKLAGQGRNGYVTLVKKKA